MEDLQTALAPEQGHAVLQPAALRHAGTNIFTGARNNELF
jgi:hypothetical protein